MVIKRYLLVRIVKMRMFTIMTMTAIELCMIGEKIFVTSIIKEYGSTKNPHHN